MSSPKLSSFRSFMALAATGSLTRGDAGNDTRILLNEHAGLGISARLAVAGVRPSPTRIWNGSTEQHDRTLARAGQYSYDTLGQTRRSRQ